MRIILLIFMVVSVTALKAQTWVPSSYFGNSYSGMLTNNFHLDDSSYKKKWSFSRYSGITTSFSFFKGGSATVVAAPLGFQVNRRLTNNLFAFANVAVAPAYVNFNQSFMSNSFNKSNQSNAYFRNGSLAGYSSASLGLQYVNDAKTFSISGSIGVERSSYPVLPYLQSNSTRPNPVFTATR